jgi:hypothetical protein
MDRMGYPFSLSHLSAGLSILEKKKYLFQWVKQERETHTHCATRNSFKKMNSPGLTIRSLHLVYSSTISGSAEDFRPTIITKILHPEFL